MKSSSVSLDDKYTLESGRVYITGLQALVRLPIMQRQRDVAAGLNTAGYISGYRGSPLGGYDNALMRAQSFLSEHHIKFHPGLNEDMAATAVWGSQHTEVFPGAKYDGVFSIWYGKGPGVDRSGDVLKHGNFWGSSANGGVLVIAGDDHGAKSSSIPHQSEQAFLAAFIPTINPASVQEYLDYGLFGFAAARYSGFWMGFKAVSDTVESSASVHVDPHRLQFAIPDHELPPEGVNISMEYAPLPFEVRLLEHRIPALHAFARANPIDRVVIDSPNARLGIVTTGKAYLDLRQALDDLGIDESKAAELGIRIYKVGLTWPVEPEGLREFAKGLDDLLVVEEKHGFIEDQLTKIFYNLDDAPRTIVGKTDEVGRVLLPAKSELTPGMIGRAVIKRLSRFTQHPEFTQRLSRLDQIEAQMAQITPALSRSPFFCSGCPHNTSTKLPEGSRAMAGIGCHAMAMFVPERETVYSTHMGAEGVTWLGHSPFTTEEHIFANIGDGTYDHSGLLAVRAAVGGDVNITYKILYNDAVAMTGGQPLEGSVTVDSIARQVSAEGVRRIAVVSDEPDKYPRGTQFPPGTTVHHRDELDELQREFREIKGVSVIIYDQTCAAEKRRRRKRGLMLDPPKRAFINDLVCEGCGDCSIQSNCVSVQPLETELGRKRRIDQSNCNKDFSCVKGFCPSFVTVHGGDVRKATSAGKKTMDDSVFETLPTPIQPSSIEPYGIVVTGIGGTGVITIGALLGMAAHVEGKGVTVLDQTGLAQKNGAVGTHVRIADTAEALHATRVAMGGARLVLGCDIVMAADPGVLATVDQGTTHAVVNAHVTPPAAFVIDNTIDLSARMMSKTITDATGVDRASFVDATRLATALLGDSIASNLFMVGFAYQSGLIPLAGESIESAIQLNAVAIDFNLQAFRLGRLAAHDLVQVETLAAPFLTQGQGEVDEPKDVDDLINRRAAFLTDYQDETYAQGFRDFVGQVRHAEEALAGNKTRLTETVARSMFKLMAYKDEYEVARLYTDGAFAEKLDRQFEGDYKLKFHLAPPLLAKRDPISGQLKKREYGPWILPALRVVAKFKGLRGSALDIFGYTEERKMERALIDEYRDTIDGVLGKLSDQSHGDIVAIAEVPDMIKGFGHVKERNVERARARTKQLVETLSQPAPNPSETSAARQASA
ncbi:MAG: indolepyruvate ferredoxin oxidoreductase family protein [Pseudomonadota bacterium]